MNRSTAHLVTLWCAVLHKTEKGVIRCLEGECSLLQFRVLVQLAAADDGSANLGALTHALLARPADTEAAAFDLVRRGWVECAMDAAGTASEASAAGAGAGVARAAGATSDASAVGAVGAAGARAGAGPASAAGEAGAPSAAVAVTGDAGASIPADAGAAPLADDEAHRAADPLRRFRVSDEGLARARDFERRVRAFLEAGWDGLAPEERALLMGMCLDAVMMPGGYFARKPVFAEPGADLPVHCYVTAIAMLTQTVNTTAKKDADLSFTDFRLLLELYPKRRGVDKRLRAREIVRFLAVGRSYVSTASARLEERGLLERIPDERDARGVLYQLTGDGRMLVEDVCEDLYAVYAGLFRLRESENARVSAMMGALLDAMEVAEKGRGA